MGKKHRASDKKQERLQRKKEPGRETVPEKPLPESTVEREGRTDRDQAILRTEKCHVIHTM